MKTDHSKKKRKKKAFPPTGEEMKITNLYQGFRFRLSQWFYILNFNAGNREWFLYGSTIARMYITTS